MSKRDGKLVYRGVKLRQATSEYPLISVRVEGKYGTRILSPLPSLKLCDHTAGLSPILIEDLDRGRISCFDWGPNGSKPESLQLALAILLDSTLDKERALKCYYKFEGIHVKNWADSFTLDLCEIREFLVKISVEKYLQGGG